MAKVTTPSDTFKSFQTVGRGITLRLTRSGYAVSKSPKPVFTSAQAQELIDDNFQARLKEWQELSEGQKQEWKTLGLQSVQSGFSLFIQEGWKSFLQGIYGVARYGQNVYMKGS